MARDPFAVVRRKLFVSVVSDTLDGLGYRSQAFAPTIRPLDDSRILLGRARTALYREVFHVPKGHNPYRLEIELIDDLKPFEIPVMACGANPKIGPWGELLTTAARARGATGALTDGLTRDVRAIRKLGFPVFSGGIGPLDSKGRGEVAAIDVPVELGGVRVESGDVIFGDADGVVSIPKKIEKQVFAAALAKVTGENRTREALERGEKLASVFKRFGIL